MKNVVILVLVSILGFSCSDDDDNQLNQLVGEWQLLSSTSPMANIETDLSGENVIYNFQKNEVLLISNKDGFSESPYTFKKDYLTGEESEKMWIVQIVTTKYIYDLSDNGIMTLSNGYVDGSILKFKRK